MVRCSIICIFLGLFSLGVFAQQDKAASQVPGYQAPVPTAAMQTEAIWIDVRSNEEYTQGHLKYAVNIPFEQISTNISMLALEKNQNIKLYCTAGIRSGKAVKILNDLGFTNVSNAGAYRFLKLQEK